MIVGRVGNQSQELPPRAARSFLRTVLETNMPFSLGSYLLGVGTVVGALAFGFGGGLLLTHTAMKENPAGHTRVERLARAESDAARRVPAAQITAAIKPDEAPEQPPAIAPNPQAGTPKPVVRKPEETPSQVQAATQLPQPIVRAARQPPPKQVEQTEKKTVESMEADRSAELSRRYAERSRYVERRPSHRGAPGTRQRGLVVEEDAAQEVAISRPPEQLHFEFGGFFGRPADADD
jgi:type IV secretory pathway VirB10-like protein